MKKENKKKENKIKKEKVIKKNQGHEEVEELEEDLPEDVKVALGMKKEVKSKFNDIDYVSELENGLDDFGIEDTSKSNFEEEFDSDLD
ncbi:hypothetical protein GYA37_02330 [candidate division WWE3 bacterium]|uniref:Uncharacterized protein n=1 Tax=candidate division WWE3 bacterium TaxID=2053526 RepID=A0A7X9E7D8_UNCKA|nr:hypothetical protein [candidate division WWE3 bacterium]